MPMRANRHNHQFNPKLPMGLLMWENPTPMTFPKPCLTCGTLTIGSYCPKHQTEIDAPRLARRKQHIKNTGQYSGEYPRLAKLIRQTATTCALCGQGWNINDPFEADHIIPGTRVTHITQLQAVHRSCNQKKSNKNNPTPQ